MPEIHSASSAIAFPPRTVSTCPFHPNQIVQYFCVKEEIWVCNWCVPIHLQQNHTLIKESTMSDEINKELRIQYKQLQQIYHALCTEMQDLLPHVKQESQHTTMQAIHSQMTTICAQAVQQCTSQYKKLDHVDHFHTHDRWNKLVLQLRQVQELIQQCEHLPSDNHLDFLRAARECIALMKHVIKMEDAAIHNNNTNTLAEYALQGLEQVTSAIANIKLVKVDPDEFVLVNTTSSFDE